MKKLIPVFFLAAVVLMTSTVLAAPAALGSLGTLASPQPNTVGLPKPDLKKLAARRSAEDWLRLVDADHYPESWQDMAAYFKLAVKQDVWVARLEKLRKPLGDESSRKFRGSNYISARFSTDASSIAVQFQTTFSTGGQRMEVVNVTLDDNQWKVSGYYIK